MFKHLIFMTPAVVFGLSACDVVQDEIYSPGGFVAVQADRYQKAVTPGQHVDRYRTFFNFVAPLALTAAHDDESATDAAEDVAAAWKAISALNDAVGDCVYKEGARTFCNYVPLEADGATQPDNSKPEAVEDSLLSFETLSLRVQRELGDLSYRMAENVGVRLDVENFDLTSLTNLLGKVFDLRDQAPALREAAAAYRDMTHIFARGVAVSCSAQTLGTRPEDRKAEAACEGLNDALVELYDSGNPWRQPSLQGEGTGERRLKDLLNRSREVIELQRASGAGDWRYWDKSGPTALAYVKQRCDALGTRFTREADAANYVKDIEQACGALDPA